jgi:hypothetical protein
MDVGGCMADGWGCTEGKLMSIEGSGSSLGNSMTGL